jgi:hypothetical protein
MLQKLSSNALRINLLKPLVAFELKDFHAAKKKKGKTDTEQLSESEETNTYTEVTQTQAVAGTQIDHTNKPWLKQNLVLDLDKSLF